MFLFMVFSTLQHILDCVLDTKNIINATCFHIIKLMTTEMHLELSVFKCKCKTCKNTFIKRAKNILWHCGGTHIILEYGWSVFNVLCCLLQYFSERGSLSAYKQSSVSVLDMTMNET